MTKKYLPILLLFSIILTSCIKEVDISLPDSESKLVITSFFTADSILTVHISKSVNIRDTVDFEIENATASVYKNDTLLEILDHDSNGFYTSKKLMQKKEHYQIKVAAPQFPPVQSIAQIPEQVQLISTDFTQNAGIDGEGESFSAVSIHFDDTPNVQNFYEIEVLMEYNRTDEKGIRNFTLFSYAPVIKAEGDLDYFPQQLLLSDELIDGKSVHLDINFYDESLNISQNTSIKVFIEFRSVSKDYYLYKKSLIRHLANQFPEIWDGAGEPVPLFSNIENGYGIFAGYTTDTDTVYKSN